MAKTKQTGLFDDHKPLPTWHDADTRYIKHCVDCGVRVAQWAREWDGIGQPDVGDLIYEIKGRCRTLADGRRCPTCYDKVIAYLEGYYR